MGAFSVWFSPCAKDSCEVICKDRCPEPVGSMPTKDYLSQCKKCSVGPHGCLIDLRRGRESNCSTLYSALKGDQRKALNGVAKSISLPNRLLRKSGELKPRQTRRRPL